jgi:hypothetical protein
MAAFLYRDSQNGVTLLDFPGGQHQRDLAGRVLYLETVV